MTITSLPESRSLAMMLRTLRLKPLPMTRTKLNCSLMAQGQLGLEWTLTAIGPVTLESSKRITPWSRLPLLL
jgi:hypothetical protein